MQTNETVNVIKRGSQFALKKKDTKTLPHTMSESHPITLRWRDLATRQSGSREEAAWRLGLGEARKAADVR